eukprot:TRINITY_DN29268_c0_g1_i1.p1 TRINITY_DN29268_c0_g1~~TRINITY_DN29268_c0_g1_i1.p1  ORF type:complete len:252 (+),score=44.67 TRINITY_DN29268_c0_g1_i1:162-917(+)
MEDPNCIDVAKAKVDEERRKVETVVPNYIDVAEAQKSGVVRFPKLLSHDDLEQVLACHQAALAAGDPKEINVQNRTHVNKRCTFLHGSTVPKDGQLIACAPRLLGKLLRATVDAAERGGWRVAPTESKAKSARTQRGDAPYLLQDIDVRRLCIRVVELWEYEPGGGLPDDKHYDAGSIITIVCLVNHSTDFTGGVFRTLESDNRQEEHHLERGDAVCFVSHKYHNITPLITGRRISLVMELWQGGVPRWCR